MQAVAIMTGTDNMSDAQKFVDWAVSAPAIEIYAGRYSVVALPVKAKKWDHFPPEVQTRMIDNDFIWAANLDSGKKLETASPGAERRIG